ncbi:phosphate propanoyltransferase [Vagococcus penaei]|uniref:phosphate propanoyltransferase n=1 Tax=Vagococcus penaei TaxID=633807 RepID=UPI0009873974|nr:phosphate propanoyltransferase [Vagococcus penaei]RSU00414.1 phosphate propanoyltransferase [Vagococcus penaei]
MEHYEEILERVLATLVEGKLSDAPSVKSYPQVTPVEESETLTIPIGISNRHVHLAQSELEKLFGTGYELKKLKDLSQPGQYACQECVTLCGPKGVIEHVRVLGPVRPDTQVEILQSDTFKLGVPGVVRLSGDLNETPGVTLCGPKGSVQLQQGVIVAQRHIHMLPEEAQAIGVTDGESVSIKFNGTRGGVLNNVVIRATNQAGLECHIDTEEANALGIKPGTTIGILKNKTNN